jgi:hypothetical protein
MMNTLVLDSTTAKWSLEQLLAQLGSGGVEVRDLGGNIVAVVLGPTDQGALTYAEASIYLNQHRDQLRQALSRRGGINTSDLLAKASAAADQAAQR